MTRRGKCSNYAGCLLAYRSEIVTVSEGEFVCPECKQALTPADEGMKPFGLSPAVLGLGGLAVIGVIAVVVGQLFSKQPTAPKATDNAAPQATAPAAVAPAPATAEPLSAAPGEPPLAAAPAPLPETLPPLSVPAASPASAPKADQPNLDLANDENQKVKTEVLKRIDLMPTISAEDKDKLYVSVERARQMGRIIVIPFASGKTALSPGDIENLRTETQSPQLRQLMRDPTAVFVILGFADTKGDEKANLRISQERADGLLKILRDKCGIINVMHAVGMGGSTLFDASGTEKNRVGEVWAVLP